MTPTQAQIEAAARELHQVASGICHPDDCKRWLQLNYSLLFAALTAAAEVGGNYIQQTNSTIDAGIRIATIERCAQVLDDAAAKATLASWADELRRLAATIRALKDS